MKLLYVFFTLLFSDLAQANEFRFIKKFHFTQGRFKVDSGKYKYIDSNIVTVFKGPKDQTFELEAIKSKELTFYTLTVKRGESLALIINDFAVMSKTSKVRILKEGWVEDIDGDGYLDIIQREKTFIMGKRKPSAHYSNDKLKIKLWNSQTGSYVEKEKTDPIYIKALKLFNFKLYTLYENKVL
ncbi:MAG: hypothetical protein JNL11_20520 [Bdellovibrionaceae bacterium]|nr:hypothetical protein [Pseudobdellovibrionaceae bacterium]